jgi:hypothetical protein
VLQKRLKNASKLVTRYADVQTDFGNVDMNTEEIFLPIEPMCLFSLIWVLYCPARNLGVLKSSKKLNSVLVCKVDKVRLCRLCVGASP